MTAQGTKFQSCQSRGIEFAGEHISLGLPVVLGFTLLPHPHATVLPTRYTTASGRSSAQWQGRQATWLDKEAMSLSPAFKLGRNCTTRFAAMQCTTASAASALQQLRSIITQTPTTLNDSSARFASSRSTAAASAATAPADSFATTQGICEQPELQHSGAAVDAGYHKQQPWLGARLDIAGYTKKGYIRGGGKEQNQDRGLIMQQFRSPNELLIGVMDGHGTFGHLVSTYLIQHLPAVLMQKLVAAAAALQLSTCNSNSSSSGDRVSSHHSKQQQQHDLQYVVMPDHSGSSNGSSLAMDLHELQQQQSQLHKRGASLRRGRSVTKHKVVQQPLAMQSSDSSSSNSNEQGYHTVPTNLISHVPLSKGLLAAVFADTDHMLVGSGINVLDSGSTALITHIGHDRLTTAWVGDSRAILGRRLVDPEKGLRGSKQQQQQVWQQWDGGSSNDSSNSSSQKWQVVQLSDDHKPERPDEQLRIVMNNGRVEQMKNAAGQGIGPYRVWFKHLDYPGLAMSRAFGDAPCRRIGVTVEPQLYVHRLTEADQVLVAATDGVWEYMTNQEVVELVGRCGNAAAAAQKLVETAEERWQEQERGAYIDDITAVVVMATPNKQQQKATVVSKL